MAPQCTQHDRLSDDIQQIKEAIVRIETTLAQGVATKDWTISEIGKIYNRVNAIIGGLAGLLAIAGSVIAYLIK
jgi:hypothetical protein